MTPTEKQLFSQLKMAISIQLRRKYPDVTEETSMWKKREIELLQQDLLETVKGRISEKWFYTHIKGDHGTLPRIDMLNLLARYVGESHWAAYKRKNKPKANTKKISMQLAIASLFIFVLTGIALSMKPNSLQFCFYDLYSQQPIAAAELQVSWFRGNESPILQDVNASGCICIQTNEPLITLYVTSPYYLEDTITRKVDKAGHSEKIALRTDDYARAIRLFSQPDQKEWNHCRSFLKEVFQENARIFHYNPEETITVDILNHEEFIDKLTSPTQALKNLEIIDIDYEDDKIAVLRFKEKLP